jgi:hypothetical protein
MGKTRQAKMGLNQSCCFGYALSRLIFLIESSPDLTLLSIIKHEGEQNGKKGKNAL